MTHETDDLRAALGRAAANVRVTGDVAASAVALERRRHRRRVAVGAATAVLAVAVAVPLVASSTGSRPSDLRPVGTTSGPSPSSSPSGPTPSASPTPTVIPTIDLDRQGPVPTAGVELGPATGTPDVPYAVDGVLRDGDRVIPLPVDRGIGFVARLGDGAAFQVRTETSEQPLVVVDAAGTELTRVPGVTSAVVGDGGARLVTTDGRELAVRDERGRVLARKSGAWYATGIIDGVAYARTEDGQRSIAWDVVADTVREIDGQLRAVDGTTRSAVLVGGGAGDADPGRLCFSVVDLDSLAPRWVGCGQLAPLGFSPSGRYLVATRTLDGGGPFTVAVVRADDGAVVFEVDDGSSGLDGDHPRTVGQWSIRMNDAETAVTFSATAIDRAPGRENALVRCDVEAVSCAVVGDARPVPAYDVMPEMVWTVASD